jgi:hypothetical protein
MVGGADYSVVLPDTYAVRYDGFSSRGTRDAGEPHTLTPKTPIQRASVAK